MESVSSIGQVILAQVGSQIDLAITLATAVGGGLAALIIQLVIHNRSTGNSPINLRWPCLLTFALGAEGVSLISGYFARGALTDATPILMNLPASEWHGATSIAKRFIDVQFDGSAILRCAVLGQVTFLIVGLVIVFLVAARNLKSLL